MIHNQTYCQSPDGKSGYQYIGIESQTVAIATTTLPKWYQVKKKWGEKTRSRLSDITLNWSSRKFTGLPPPARTPHPALRTTSEVLHRSSYNFRSLRVGTISYQVSCSEPPTRQPRAPQRANWAASFVIINDELSQTIQHYNSGYGMNFQNNWQFFSYILEPFQLNSNKIKYFH